MRHDLQSMRHSARPGRTPRAQRGITLVEIMATTTISAIILGMAAPSFLDLVRANQARSAAQQMTSLLNVGRTEAIKRNVPVLVCPSRNGTTCDATILAGQWAQQTIVCYDANSDGACDASTAAAPNPIRVRSRVDPSVTLTGPTAAVRFNGMGAANDSASFALSTGSGASQSASVAVGLAGTVRMY